MHAPDPNTLGIGLRTGGPVHAVLFPRPAAAAPSTSGPAGQAWSRRVDRRCLTTASSLDAPWMQLGGGGWPACSQGAHKGAQ